ncbi:hypothetical protein CVS40_5812 [Lucilia cuprina]|nr:hypothetical protein CVS40_5812 [Lucilia cuprina]
MDQCGYLDSQDNWPKSNPPAIALMEQRKVEVHCSVTDELNIIQRFSSYRRALAVIAYIHRFLRSTNKRLQKAKFESLTLSHEELNNAKIVYIRLTQKFHYSEDLKNLSDSKHLSKKSSLLTLNPFLDAQGLMRVNGRLANASLTSMTDFP